MGEYVITGSKKLKGTITVNGSKNAVLPILAASLLNGSLSVLENCPDISDTKTAVEILQHIGCAVERENKTMIVNSSSACNTEIPTELVKKMRSSIIFTGPLLSRAKKVKLTYPGGCELGKRPIDIHLSAFKKMGVNITEENDIITFSCEKLKGCDIAFDFPSVGATENIILAAVLAEGVTNLSNCAREPEIADMCRYLVKAGAKIDGIGSSDITITGVKKLHPATHSIVPDRIEAGTYMIMTAAAGGKVLLKNTVSHHLKPLIEILSKMGCKIQLSTSSISIKAPSVLENVPFIQTLPYPGIPTDLQPQLTALSAVSKGMCRFDETIFESRTAHIGELLKLGADISLKSGTEFVVNGVTRLKGNEVFAKDLRGGAALITAGLCADGTTIIKNSCHVERGYENIVENLLNLGANITLKN